MRAMLGVSQCGKEVRSNLIKTRTTKMLQAIHSLEASAPGFTNGRLRGAQEGEFQIRESELVVDVKAGIFDVSTQPSTHEEVVPVCCAGGVSVVSKQLASGWLNGLMPKEVIDFGKGKPAGGL